MINYYLLTKPGIIMGNLLTVAAGFLLASQGVFLGGLFFATLLGLTLVMGSACVFNNYIDRRLDQKMERTKNRVLVKGLVSGKNALIFACFLGICGHLILYFYTNLLTLSVAAFGFFVYVILYSLWKCRTVYGTAIGSIAGGVPPVVGYCAIRNQFDTGALVLFLLMVLWQMPHFFSIAIYRLDDYKAGNVPVLPIKKGMMRTKIHMVLYIVGFIVATCLLTAFHYTGMLYLSIAVLGGMAWLLLGFYGFKKQNEKVWAKQMFRVSLAVITALCLVMPFDVL